MSTIQALFHPVSDALSERPIWLEVVDVVVVAVILYQVLRLVSGTRATQLIVGLSVLVAGGLVANQLGLVLLTWLFQNSATYIVVLLVVLFQPELRRALDQVGRLPHLRQGHQQERARAMAEVINAAEQLSLKRHGALIAVERDVGLEDYITSGVRLNGDVSAEFLTSIFYPNSPLHDGAVIIRGSRIVAASCMLPMPEEGTMRERLGARHRAAVGLTQASDATVVVVSEETGGISVVEDGHITRDLDASKLRSVIAEHRGVA